MSFTARYSKQQFTSQNIYGVPGWAPQFSLAAAIIVALTAAAIAAIPATAATAAEEQDQDDDPAHITAAETIIATEITHKNTSIFLMQPSMPLIPWYS